jgi:hypothetical protein
MKTWISHIKLGHFAVIVSGIGFFLAPPLLSAEENEKMRERTQIVAEANSKIEKPGWVLTFHDEFDGPELDTAKWHTFYRDVKAIYVIKEGILHLRINKTLPEPGANKVQRVSSIQTVASKIVWPKFGKEWPQGKSFSQQYGWFEIRARCPKGSGRSSGFWMMPADQRYLKLKEDGGIRESPNEAIEIDISEQLGREPMSNHFTVHFGRSEDSYEEGHRQESNAREFTFDHSKDFHIYALEWTRENLIWYVDGKEVARSDKAPQRPFFIFLSLYEMMPGIKSWSGMLEPNLSYPCDFEIDYIRVYQRTGKSEERH